ncbi:pilus assembly protein [Rhizobium sp. R634]|uniref:Flp family type IVb pilin n=1 Tax=Rhizobium sp. R634 TaxID=1764274 RepID=UPI000B53183E|nr:Flp family type IVb pilin [Rhizobium sp. R634]OWV71640.1 pilus assembly protein [Rhizobium sp. R634]
MRLLKAYLTDQRGATAVEYGLIAAIICTALIAGLGVFTGSLQNVFNVIIDALPTN